MARSHGRVLVVVPVRAGSQSVVNKNREEVLGKPLMVWTLEKLADLKVGMVCVSSDSREYLELATMAGADCTLHRPHHLSTGAIPIWMVLSHTLEVIDPRGDQYDWVLSVQVTSPFLRIDSIRRILEFSVDPCAVGAGAPIRHSHPMLARHFDPATSEAVYPEEIRISGGRYPRQARSKFYYFTGAAFLRHRRFLTDDHAGSNALGDRPYLVPTSEKEAINIDSEFDLEVVRALAERNPSWLMGD